MYVANFKHSYVILIKTVDNFCVMIFQGIIIINYVPTLLLYNLNTLLPTFFPLFSIAEARITVYSQRVQRYSINIAEDMRVR